MEKLLKEIVVVDGMMMPDKPQLSMIRAHKFEDNAVGLIYSEAPHFMVLRM